MLHYTQIRRKHEHALHVPYSNFRKDGLMLVQ
jgi:hypothetical protein